MYCRLSVYSHHTAMALGSICVCYSKFLSACFITTRVGGNIVFGKEIIDNAENWLQQYNDQPHKLILLKADKTRSKRISQFPCHTFLTMNLSIICIPN